MDPKPTGVPGSGRESGPILFREALAGDQGDRRAAEQ